MLHKCEILHSDLLTYKLPKITKPAFPGIQKAWIKGCLGFGGKVLLLPSYVDLEKGIYMLYKMFCSKESLKALETIADFFFFF